jgi:protein AbiQ
VLNVVFLSEKFYAAYSGCLEIEQKDTRPYIRVQVLVNDVLWAIPLRSNIKHGYALWTNKEHGCGIDFTKAVVIEKPSEYISGTKPHIRPEEFKVIKRMDNYTVTQKLQQYIKTYKKAKEHLEVKRNKQIVQCSTLQYFEKYL